MKRVLLLVTVLLLLVTVLFPVLEIYAADENTSAFDEIWEKHEAAKTDPEIAEEIEREIDAHKAEVQAQNQAKFDEYNAKKKSSDTQQDEEELRNQPLQDEEELRNQPLQTETVNGNESFVLILGDVVYLLGFFTAMIIAMVVATFISRIPKNGWRVVSVILYLFSAALQLKVLINRINSLGDMFPATLAWIMYFFLVTLFGFLIILLIVRGKNKDYEEEE